MEKIKYLLELLKIEAEKYHEKLQPPLHIKQSLFFKNTFEKVMQVDLDICYLEILHVTDGIDNDGVVLYSSKTTKIEGYNDRFIEGIIEANHIWHEDVDKKNYIFYAESELYLFFKDVLSGIFYCAYRDDLKDIIFKTKNSIVFFEKIINLCTGNSIE